MKSHRLVTLCFAVAVVSVGCASSGRSRESTDRTTMTAADIEKNADVPIEILLQRKFPGIQVYRNSNGELALSIRGEVDMHGEPKEPLYVINNVQMELGGRGLQTVVNPIDIESIQVLKGAEAAIYGGRGANGVIIIKSKSPEKK